MNKQEQFQFYCQKVLPLVYDDSLSYYEVLCKLRTYLNEVIKNNNEMMDTLSRLITWIDTQLEVYTKEQLNEWLNDGTLESLINDVLLKDLSDRVTHLENRIVEFQGDKTGENDISDLLFDCINKANLEKKNVFIPSGLYKVTKTVELEGINNLDIICDKGVIFTVSLTSENTFNVIKFNNSNNINFYGATCINTNDNIRERNLYNGAFLTFNSSTFIKVHDCISQNMNYLVQLYKSCHDVQIYSNYYYNKSIKEQSSMSAILCYSSYNVDIYENFIQGQTYDGTLSVFGVGSNNVNVYNNRLINYYDLNTVNYLSQGITIDQGCKFVNVFNNEVRGYWYGIDVKSNVEFIDVHHNTVKGCKIGITNRDGEAITGTSTNEVYIRDNIITFNELYHKNLDPYELDGFQQFGITSLNRYGCKITNNEIAVNYTMTTKCCGIYLKPNTEIGKEYLEETLIKDNKISLLYAFGTFYYAIDGSTALFLNSGKNVTVKNNYLRFYSVRQCDTIVLKNTNADIRIEDNVIKNQNPAIPMLKVFDINSTLTHSFIENNTLEDTTILLCQDSFIETKNNYFNNNLKLRRIIDNGYTSKLVLGTNTADTIYNVTTLYTPTILFSINAIVYNTGECLNGTFCVKIDSEGTATLSDSQILGNTKIKIEVQNNSPRDFNIRINNQTEGSIRIYTALQIISADQIINIL